MIRDVVPGFFFDLQSAYQATLGDQTAFADFLCFIIRKRRFAYIDSIGFLNEEYLIASVDFIVALRRTKGRRRWTLRSPSPPSSGLHLLTPGIRCGGALLLPRAWGNVGSFIPVQVVHHQFRILFGCLCSGWYRSRFSRVVGLISHVFHYWGDRLFVPAVTWGVQWSFVGFALTAIGAFVLADNGMENLCC